MRALAGAAFGGEQVRLPVDGDCRSMKQHGIVLRHALGDLAIDRKGLEVRIRRPAAVATFPLRRHGGTNAFKVDIVLCDLHRKVGSARRSERCCLAMHLCI